MKRNWLLWVILLGVGGGAFWYWKKAATATEASTSMAPDLPTVSVVRASREDLAKTLTLTAEFVPYQEVDVMAKIAGYVQKTINVNVGDSVKQG